MNYLDRIIKDQVAAGVVGSINETTRQFAQELVAELMRDEEFIREMKLAIRKAFTEVLYDLHADVPETDDSPLE